MPIGRISAPAPAQPCLTKSYSNEMDDHRNGGFTLQQALHAGCTWVTHETDPAKWHAGQHSTVHHDSPPSTPSPIAREQSSDLLSYIHPPIDELESSVPPSVPSLPCSFVACLCQDLPATPMPSAYPPVSLGRGGMLAVDLEDKNGIEARRKGLMLRAASKFIEDMSPNVSEEIQDMPTITGLQQDDEESGYAEQHDESGNPEVEAQQEAARDSSFCEAEVEDESEEYSTETDSEEASTDEEDTMDWRFLSFQEPPRAELFVSTQHAHCNDAVLRSFPIEEEEEMTALSVVEEERTEDMSVSGSESEWISAGDEYTTEESNSALSDVYSPRTSLLSADSTPTQQKSRLSMMQSAGSWVKRFGSWRKPRDEEYPSSPTVQRDEDSIACDSFSLEASYFNMSLTDADNNGLPPYVPAVAPSQINPKHRVQSLNRAMSKTGEQRISGAGVLLGRCLSPRLVEQDPFAKLMDAPKYGNCTDGSNDPDIIRPSGYNDPDRVGENPPEQAAAPSTPRLPTPRLPSVASLFRSSPQASSPISGAKPDGHAASDALSEPGSDDLEDPQPQPAGCWSPFALLRRRKIVGGCIPGLARVSMR